MEIIVVDDDIETADLIEMFFKRGRHGVRKAHTAEKGMDLFKEKKPDLVILDMVLPDKSGIELLKEMKGIDSGISVVMITGYREPVAAGRFPGIRLAEIRFADTGCLCNVGLQISNLQPHIVGSLCYYYRTTTGGEGLFHARKSLR